MEGMLVRLLLADSRDCQCSLIAALRSPRFLTPTAGNGRRYELTLPATSCRSVSPRKFPVSGRSRHHSHQVLRRRTSSPMTRLPGPWSTVPHDAVVTTHSVMRVMSFHRRAVNNPRLLFTFRWISLQERSCVSTWRNLK